MPLYEYLCETCGRGETFEKLETVVDGRVPCTTCSAPVPILPAGRMIGVSPTMAKTFTQDDDRQITTNAEMRAYEKELEARGQCIVSKDDAHYKALKEGTMQMRDVKAQHHGFNSWDAYQREAKRKRELTRNGR